MGELNFGIYKAFLMFLHWQCDCALIHCDRVTHYGDGSMLCKNPIFFTMKNSLKFKILWFLPEASFGLRVLSLPASVCLCVRPSVCVCGKHLLVRAITHHPFKLGSPNLDNGCKRPWLRSLLFWGVIDLDLQGQIELQSQNLPHFELVHAITHHQLKLQFPNLEQKCILALFISLPILGVIEIDLQFNF